MNPYDNLPHNAFWKLAVADKSLFDQKTIWTPKFNILKNDKVSTYGSCFAQHIGRALKARGYNWLITEAAPGGLSVNDREKYNYDIFSSRTANIYTTSLLKQWLNWATAETAAPAEFWIKNERYFDPFRPVIEPDGFSTLDEMLRSREHTISCFRDSVKSCNVFVFTLGLTECWVNEPNGYEYPMCPGTVAGEHNPTLHKFINSTFSRVIQNLKQSVTLLRRLNPKIKIILTVSPVPLTATMSNKNVISATMYSKSVLRAVAGELADTIPFVDYFPSYEIINSPVFKGVFFNPNQRTVNMHGVNFVMDNFFSGLEKKFGISVDKKLAQKSRLEQAVCEEELLEAFSKR